MIEQYNIQLISNDEIFITVKNYDNYLVSNYGRIFSLISYRILKGSKCKDGYFIHKLSNEKESKLLKAHRIVAISFIENKYNLPVVNHKNGIKTDNRVQNLEWTTFEENTRHAIEFGISSFKGELNPNCRLTYNKVVQILRMNKKGISQKEICQKFNLKPCNVSKIITKRIWKHVSI